VLDLLGFEPSRRRGDQVRGPCPVHRSRRSFAAHLGKNVWFELFVTAGVNAISFAGNGLFGMIHAAGDQGGGNAPLGSGLGGKGQPDGSTEATAEAVILSSLTGATANSVGAMAGSERRCSDVTAGHADHLGSVLLNSPAARQPLDQHS
jgi:hypothetical protein